jgi:hypothetical protein
MQLSSSSSVRDNNFMMSSFLCVSYIIGNGREKIKGTHNLFLQPVPEFQEKGESE